MTSKIKLFILNERKEMNEAEEIVNKWLESQENIYIYTTRMSYSAGKVVVMIAYINKDNNFKSEQK